MENSFGKLLFGVGLDTSSLSRDANVVKGEINKMSSGISSSFTEIDGKIQKMATALGGFYAINQAKAFASKVYEVRSVFQDTEAAMKVFLGSGDKAKKFMKELQDYAWYNMFEFSDLTQASSQLLAYGNDVEGVIPILDKLSNIATATKQPLMELVDMYNRAKNVGQIDSNGFDQWAKRGLVINDTLKSVGIEVERGSVSFEHLSKAIDVATSDGGKFHNIMGEQMNNLSASYGQLQDDITNALNEIGESSEGFMKKGIEAASFVVDNYKEIASLIIDGVVAYGAYRTALIAINAAMKTNTALFALNRQAALLSAVAHKEVSVAQMLVARGSNAIKAAFLSNPITIIAVALSAVAYGFYKVATAENAAEVAARSHTDWLNKQKEQIKSTTDLVNDHIATIKDETKSIYDRIEAYRASKKEMPDVYGNKSFSEVVKMTDEEHSTAHRKYSDNLKFKEEEERLTKINSLLNEYNRIMDIRSGKTKGTLQGHELSKLESDVQDMLGANFWEKMKFGVEDIVPALEKARKEIVDIRNENYQIIKQQEYEALSVGDKIKSREQELKALELQKKLLEDALGFTGKTADEIEQATKNWSGFDIQSLANLKKLQNITTEIIGLKSLVDSLKSGKSSEITTFQQAKEKARLDWIDAKKRLSEYEKVSNFEVSKYNELKDKVEKAKKDYENLGGVTSVARNTETKNDVAQRLKAIEQQKIAIKDSIVRAELEIEQARINAIEDSEEKRTSQIALDKRRMQIEYDELLQTFINNENELSRLIWENENPRWREQNKVFVDPVNTTNYADKLDSNILDILQKKQDDIDNYEHQKDAERLNLLLKDYEDYLQKRKAIKEKYNKEINTLEDGRVKGVNDNEIDRAKSVVNTRMQKALEDIDIDFLANNKSIANLFKGISDNSLKVLRASIRDIEKLIRLIKGTEKDDGGMLEKLGIGVDEFEELKNNSAVIDWLEQKISEFKEETKSREADGRNVFDAISDSIKSLQNGDIEKGIDGLRNALSIIVEMSDMVSDLLSNIAEATGGSNATAQAIKDVGNTISSTISGAVAGGSAGGWIGAIVGAVLGAATSLFDILGRNAAEKERNAIELHKFELQKLQREYDELGKSIRNAYSYDKSKDISHQIYILQQRAKYLEEQAKRASVQRKDGSMQDEGLYNEYRNEINNINNQIDELRAQAADAIFGESIQSAIDKFADAYVNAWESGNDVASGIKDVVNSMIRGVIIEMLKNDLAPMVSKVREMIANKLKHGRTWSGQFDDVNAYIEDFLTGEYGLNLDGTIAKGINEKYKALMEQFFGNERETTTKGFASMSQDSADELNGRFTAIQAMIFEINSNVKQQTAANATILLRLSGIEENTAYCRRLDGIDQDINYMRIAIETIRDRGVTIYGR